MVEKLLTERRASWGRASVRTIGAAPVWLPLGGAQVYRTIAASLAELTRGTVVREVRVLIANATGTSHVALLVTARASDGPRRRAITLPRHVVALLAAGFCELADDS